MITIKILGNPIPLQRPRACKRGNYIQMYDSQVTEKRQIQWQIRSSYSETPLLTPLIVDLEFGMPIPKSTSKVKSRLMREGEIPYMVKPDLDNLVKFILDCLNEIVFHDDSQIVEINARKKYASEPGTLIRIQSLNDLVKGHQEKSHESNSRDGR